MSKRFPYRDQPRGRAGMGRHPVVFGDAQAFVEGVPRVALGSGVAPSIGLIGQSIAAKQGQDRGLVGSQPRG